MKRHTITLTLATAVLALSSAAVAESPIVLNARSAVDAIDASAKRIKKIHQEKEIGGGVVELTLWKNSRGKPIKAKLGNYGDSGGTETELYWKDGVLVFTFESDWVLAPRFAKRSETEHSIATERRVYYSGGKPGIVRIGKVVTARHNGKTVAVNKKKYPSTPSATIPQSDPRWQESVDNAADAGKTALKANLADRA